MKKMLAFLSVSLLLVILSACSSNDPGKPETTTVTGEPSEKIQLLLAADGTTTYYAYVARDKGFFEEEGLNVELVSGKGSSYVVQQVGAETVDVGITAAASLLPAWDKGIDIEAFYQINVKNLFDFIVTPESGITSIDQLKGKYIGVSDLGGGEVPMVRSILSSAGLDPDKDVTFRAIGTEATSILAAFEKGTIAAYSGGAHDLISLYGKGFESNSLIPEEYKLLPSTAIIANGNFMEKSPEIAEKLARAIAKATDFSINNPDETYDLMKAAVPEQYTDEQIAHLFLDTFIDLTTPVEPEKGYGFIYKDSWELYVELFSQGESPVVVNGFDINTYLNDSLLENINAF